MNLKYFPFDQHICEIHSLHPVRIGYEGYHNEREGIVFQTVFKFPSRAVLEENDEWELLNITLDPKILVTQVYEEVNVAYPIFKIIFELKRKPSFYVLILILPSILVSSISMIGFLLPSESGEKVSLQLTALLSYVLLLLVVVDIIPPTGEKFPLIGMCFSFIGPCLKRA